MKKVYLNQEIEITDFVFPNKGVGRFNGEEVFIKNAIPSQKVIVDIKKKKQKFEGRLKKVIKKADYEFAPLCDVFEYCGGCTFQNIAYEKELEFKQNNVLNLLKEANINNYKFLGIEKSPLLEQYRNKMEFSFGDDGKIGSLSLGLKKIGNYYEVVNTKDCKIVSKDIRLILQETLNYFKNLKETFYHRIKKTGSLRHLLIRQTKFTDEIMVALVTTSSFKANLDEFANILLNLNLDAKIVGIMHIVNDSVADIIKADKMNIIFGRDYFYEKLLGLTFKISLFSFFQTNSAGAEVLYSIVKEFTGSIQNNIILDLYCGTGTIAQILSQNANKIYGIEIVEEAVEKAKENTKINNIDNIEFIAGDVYKVVKNLDLKPDLIILDPPREGVSAKAIHKIISFNAKKIIYISCKASSLAKDLKIFIENGYKIDKIKLVDMFPRTYHVETVVLMVR